MAQNQTVTTLDPARFALGADVLFDAAGLRPISEVLAWVWGLRVQCHLALNVSADDWDDYSGGATDAVGTLRFPDPTGTSVEYLHTHVWISTDIAENSSLELGGMCNLTGSDEVTLSFALTGSVGTVTQTVLCDTDDTESTATLAFASATLGGEWCNLTVSTERTTGSSSNQVRTIRVEETIMTPPLPDPIQYYFDTLGAIYTNAALEPYWAV